MEQARQDPTAFAPLYERYFSPIYAYCRRRVVSPEDAEDLTSLVFSQALAGLGTYRGGAVAAWLYGIAHHAVANHYRGQLRHPAISLDALAPDTASSLSISDDPGFARVARAEERVQIAQLLAALPDEARELFLLRVVEGLSAREIGMVVGKSEGAVRVALHRIIQRLRQSYPQGLTENGE